VGVGDVGEELGDHDLFEWCAGVVGRVRVVREVGIQLLVVGGLIR
jgi:hypothetical protein